MAAHLQAENIVTIYLWVHKYKLLFKLVWISTKPFRSHVSFVHLITIVDVDGLLQLAANIEKLEDKFSQQTQQMCFGHMEAQKIVCKYEADMWSYPQQPNANPHPGYI